MTRSLEELVSRLEQFLPALREGREADVFANDLFEAVDDLVHLGRFVIAGDTRVNYPARVRQEQNVWERLDLLKRTRMADVRGYEPIFDLAGQILLIAGTIETPPDGHLGFLKVVREHFAFLQSEFGLAIVREEPIRIRYASNAVYVELAWAKDVSSSCSFGCEANPDAMFWIDDLLFLYGDRRFQPLPEELELDSESVVERWIALLAGIFHEYGHAFLRAQPGICEELKAAQEARDRKYSEEMESRLRATAIRPKAG